MAKKHFGKVFAFAAVAGAAMGAVTYFLRYKSFHKELDEEFHDFEDEFDDFDDDKSTNSTAARNYVPLNSEKPAEKTQPDDLAKDIPETETVPEGAIDDSSVDSKPEASVLSNTASEMPSTEETEAFSNSTTIVEDTAE